MGVDILGASGSGDLLESSTLIVPSVGVTAAAGDNQSFTTVSDSLASLAYSEATASKVVCFSWSSLLDDLRLDLCDFSFFGDESSPPLCFFLESVDFPFLLFFALPFDLSAYSWSGTTRR